MIPMTKTEKSRMRLFRIAQGNPASIPQLLDAIKNLADEALKDTLDVSKREAIKLLKENIDAIRRYYEKELKSILNSIDGIIEKKVKAVKPPKGDPGEQGPAPSAEFLLELIRPLIPHVQDGKTPTKEELAVIAKPLLAELLSQDLIINRVIAERDKEMSDKMFGTMTDMIAAEISKIKRFGGGGSGDRVQAGAGISISFNNAGKKVITATGSASVETPTGTVDGSNTTFTVTATPNWIVADGVTYYEGAGYSRSGTTITMDIAPSSYIRVMI